MAVALSCAAGMAMAGQPSDPFLSRSGGAMLDSGPAVVPEAGGPGTMPPGAMPTLGRPDAAAAGAPPVGRADPLAPPLHDDLRLPPALADRYANPGADRAASDGLLLAARRALAVGDVRRAAALVAQAKQMPVRYAPTDDTPERVEAALARYQEVNALDKGTQTYRRAYARMLMEQAEALLRWGDYEQADQLAAQAARQQVDYGPFDARPEELLRRIAGLRQQGAAQTRTPSGVMPAVAMAGPGPDPVAPAYYVPSQDATRNILVSGPPAAAETIATPPGQPLSAEQPAPSPGLALFQQGEAALKAHDRDRAYQLFRQASAYMNELDPLTAQRLQDHLQLLSMPRPAARGVPPGQPGSPAEEAAARQFALQRQVYADVGQQEANAKALLAKDPKGALALLQETRQRVEAAGLQPAVRDQMLRRLDRAIADTQQFIEQNRPRIELAEKNDRVKQDIKREELAKEQMREKIALKVDQYNRLIDEHRYEEAVVVSKQMGEIAPNDPTVKQILLTAPLIRNVRDYERIKERKEDGFVKEMLACDEAAIPFSGNDPLLFPDAKKWKELSDRRGKLAREHQRHGSEREIEIEKKLKTPIAFSFRNKPLSQVLDQLAKLADINIKLDEEGLRQEGVSPETPVSLEVSHEIMLKSVLNLILEDRHLCYVIKDEVLKITSEQMKTGQIYTVSYPVGDLVMPIPNFVPNPRMGIAGALHEAMSNAGLGGMTPFGSSGTPLMSVASKDGKPNSATINPSVLAQVAGRSPSSAGGAGLAAPNNPPAGGAGPGGLGGAAAADFDDLIELITTTVAPKSWEQNGGQGNIAQFPTNLSLVVSQTQEVHEQISDLLEQLRRMQDLQITIEVRFITLSDSFFERIGVDFDFNIAKNNVNLTAAGYTPIIDPTTGMATLSHAPGSPTSIGGLQNSGNNPAGSGLFTTDLDIPFKQGTYALAVPQFGGWDSSAATAAGSLGFAIMSDIEAYFFVTALQADKRSNVLQAPKVTLFNGQQAFVSDTSQTPFVVSVIPVVGDFAAAEQPVIVVLSEGTFMTVQAVVSNDRRFVRMTLVPFFSKIGNVQTFTFTGSDSSTTDTTKNNLINATQNLWNNNTNNNTTTHTGVTVQLPTFSYVTVTTTVSVPDGGTVLLGGIKRLSEGRTEYGIPILDKVPYLDRLFKNTGIGRDTSSLMMMVTPRIIIQEEEEEKLGIQAPP
jgi:general secretion pathway protein D